MSVPKITLQLTSEEALVFFDFLNRHHRDGEVEIRHVAEDRVLRRPHGQLNGQVLDPLMANYSVMLEAARHLDSRNC